MLYALLITLLAALLVGAAYLLFTRFVLNKQETPRNAAVVTPALENLGTPFSKAAYARNVWDMQVYKGRIYLGHGNSSNKSPSPNAGPIPIIYYDPENGKYVTEFKVNEEQIDRFRVLGGKLYIPGHDARDSWNLGNFYRLDDEQWTLERTIPGGIHVYDLVSLNANIFAAIGTDKADTVLMSADGGEAWSPVKPVSGDRFYPFGSRTYTLIQFSGKVYAFSVLFNSDYYLLGGLIKLSTASNNRVLVSDGTNASVIRVPAGRMLPGAPAAKPFKLVRTEVAFGNMIYISGEINNDHQWLPEALYAAPSINEARRVSFAEEKVLPTDILVRPQDVYVLVYKKIAPYRYLNIVYKSSDLLKWAEVVRFTYDTFARSFEELNGDFYFGMGCNTDVISESTGRILRIRKDAY